MQSETGLTLATINYSGAHRNYPRCFLFFFRDPIHGGASCDNLEPWPTLRQCLAQVHFDLNAEASSSGTPKPTNMGISIGKSISVWLVLAYWPCFSEAAGDSTIFNIGKELDALKYTEVSFPRDMLFSFVAGSTCSKRRKRTM